MHCSNQSIHEWLEYSNTRLKYCTLFIYTVITYDIIITSSYFEGYAKYGFNISKTE